ncbi:hypothetical protein JCM3775_007599 [Rhodotorula graminis]|uniref:F-box domain-containing protein n=1 Tax=Rhodotorula graminis (strain WP1) TaxID=578459 RepID=A0A194SAS3_RHOGW|nr:uncharacterized protein RHOBADRAFT_51399 [Rhodotorula graminis WP1]KPV77560.1 hypothetical protein RHOBADRAFT_51399 [Rhodotorula graminis WP1]
MASFNDLPIELVRRIWSFLEHDPAGKRHLCTAVVPDVRRHNFVFTRISSAERLHTFASLVRRPGPLSRWFVGVKSVAESVRDLELFRIEVKSRAKDLVATKQILKSLASIMRRCREVQSLLCHGQGAMPVLLSSLPAPPLDYPKLKEISLYEISAQPGMFLSYGHFARLRQIPALRDLVIDFERDDGEAFGTLQTSRPPATGPSPVTDLSLCAGESLATPAAALFIADFAQLNRLEITLRDGVNLGPLLQACPVALKVLTIHYCEELLEDEDEVEQLNVAPDLARFVHLEELTLGKGTFSPTCELFAILSSHNPRVRILTLESGTKLVADKVLNFVLARGGPSRQLEEVVLDSVYFYSYPRPSEWPDLPDVVDGTFRFERRWILPKWTRRFGLGDARAVIAAAERVGVRLEGTLAEAVEYDTVRASEEAYLQTRRDEILYSLRGLFGEGEGEGEV